MVVEVEEVGVVGHLQSDVLVVEVVAAAEGEGEQKLEVEEVQTEGVDDLVEVVEVEEGQLADRLISQEVGEVLLAEAEAGHSFG